MDDELLLNNINSIQLNDGTTLNISNNKEINSLKSNSNNFISESFKNYSLNLNEFPSLSTSNKDHHLKYNSILNSFSTNLNKSTINDELSAKTIVNQNQILNDILTDTRSAFNTEHNLKEPTLLNQLTDTRSAFNTEHNLKEPTILNQLPDTRSLINNLSESNSNSLTNYQNLVLDLKWTTRDIMIFYLNRFTSLLSGKTCNDDLKNKLIKDNQVIINTLTNLKLRSKLNINQYDSFNQFNSINFNNNGLNNEIYLNFDYGLRTSLINQLIKNQDLITMNSELFTNEIKKLVIFENNLFIQKLLNLTIGYVDNDSKNDHTNCLDDNLDDIKKEIKQLYDLYENYLINKDDIDTYAKKFGLKIVNLETKLQDLDLLKKEIIEIKFNLNLSTLNSNQNIHIFDHYNLDQKQNFYRQPNLVEQGFNLENFDIHKFNTLNFNLNPNLNESKIDHQNFNSSNVDQQNFNLSNIDQPNSSQLLIKENTYFRFDLDNINEFFNSNFISKCSQPFEIDNYSFQLGFIISKFQDNGKIIKIMEVYLKCENDDPNDDWYCKVINCEFIIFSTNGKDKTIKLSNLEFTYKKSFHLISDKFNKYVTIEELRKRENGFINDDIMSVGINLDIV